MCVLMAPQPLLLKPHLFRSLLRDLPLRFKWKSFAGLLPMPHDAALRLHGRDRQPGKYRRQRRTCDDQSESAPRERGGWERESRYCADHKCAEHWKSSRAWASQVVHDCAASNDKCEAER